MALRDAFGFTSLPAGSAAVFQERPGSQTERPSLPTDNTKWVKVGLPGLPRSGSDVPDSIPVQQVTSAQAAKQLASLKALVRGSGDPGQARPALWYLASGGYAKRQAALAAQSPVLFEKWAGSVSALPQSVLVQVDTDVRTVNLTWRNHALFKTAEGISSISRVVVALLAHNKNLGYTRQLTHIVAWVLVVFGGPKHEEAVFWTLAALLQDKLFGYCNGQWLLGVRVEQEVLTRLVSRKIPRLNNHLSSLSLSVASFTQPWLASLYVSQLPPTTLARVWDSMVVEGPKVLLRVGLALLKMYDQTLSSCSFPEVLRKVLDLRVARTLDSAGLMAAAFNGCGSLPGGQLHQMREAAMATLQQQARPPSPGAASSAANTLRRTSPSSGDVPPAGSSSSCDRDSGASISAGSSGFRSMLSSGSLSRRHRSSSGNALSMMAGSGGHAVTATVIGPDSGGSSTIQAVAVVTSGSDSDSGSASGSSSMVSTAPTMTSVSSPGPSGNKSGVSLGQMLARLMGGAKGGVKGVSSVAEGASMRRCATTTSVPALAAC